MTSEEPTQPAKPETRPELRIGDREREQAVTHLGTAFGEGRLELAEYDERVAAAYGAKTASDLLHLTADLPLATREHPASSAAQADPAPRSRAAQPRATEGEPVSGWLRATWLAYASAVSINLVIWLVVGLGNGGDFPYFWPMWVAGPWGVILLFRTFGARLSDPGR